MRPHNLKYILGAPLFIIMRNIFFYLAQYWVLHPVPVLHDTVRNSCIRVQGTVVCILSRGFNKGLKMNS